MATLSSAGGGVFTLTPTPREIITVQRATPQGMTPLAFMELKITSWIRGLRDKQDEQDAATLQQKYEAATPSVRAQVDALLN